MSDKKDLYSKASQYYVENAASSGAEKDRYDKSKLRENRHNNDWIKQKVNLNTVVDHFAPDGDAMQSGAKMRFSGTRYEVVADMAGGYLRIYDKNQRYVKLDGTAGTNKETHFKIKKREEM